MSKLSDYLKMFAVRLIGRDRVTTFSLPYYRWRAAQQTKSFLRTLDQRNLKLNVGCGFRTLDGWINIDIAIGYADVICDVRKGLPFADRSSSLIFCEHLIEHLDKCDGETLLREFYRILQPGGVLRISTPDAGRFFTSYVNNDGFLNHPNFVFEIDTPMDRINRMMRENGDHLWVYDAHSLSRSLTAAGFEKVIVQSFQLSVSADMHSVDSPAREYESMYIEAVKMADNVRA